MPARGYSLTDAALEVRMATEVSTEIVTGLIHLVALFCVDFLAGWPDR